MTRSDPAHVPVSLTDTDVTITPDSELYQPPADADATDQLDASVDGTSASHYGANDPALYEEKESTPD
ncbi:hypothetical protein [Deinococcus sp. QL22]|uniref:hypothetical protein n=1 Tax=Deinococcus sp. QL22 TaxID=2939437 RepID=UPI0020172EC2|nr:hypothetical protein [Deinococcus sp. QL22]UQN09643.1 hypothetical protein M1R55_26210 [Deinococcus sp. QL22]